LGIPATALLVATMDTKGREALFLAECLEKQHVKVMILDAGIRGKSPAPVDVTRQEVAIAAGKTLEEVQAIGHEGKSLEAMVKGAIQVSRKLYDRDKINAVIGLGGSMGTTLGTGVMRTFPVGFPKLMISTMASRDTRAFVGTKDIMMLHSVCDLAGLNRITRKILHNGAMALAGMMRHPDERPVQERPLVFVSTLGTTEACAQQIRGTLEEQGKEVVIFHTVGAGGKAMEEMIDQENIAALVDLSLHEMADHRFGGDYDAGAARGSAALERKLPTVLVPGNIDFLVTGPLDNARKQFPQRPYHVHNAAITVVRTRREELAQLAKDLAGLCNEAGGPFKILVPIQGFSAFDHEKGPLHDPGAPEFFAACLKAHLDDRSSLVRLACHINDPDFGRAVIEAVNDLTIEGA
jgi:uncharacterized protein (UPF0261 family)